MPKAFSTRLETTLSKRNFRRQPSLSISIFGFFASLYCLVKRLVIKHPTSFAQVVHREAESSIKVSWDSTSAANAFKMSQLASPVFLDCSYRFPGIPFLWVSYFGRKELKTVINSVICPVKSWIMQCIKVSCFVFFLGNGNNLSWFAWRVV